MLFVCNINAKQQFSNDDKFEKREKHVRNNFQKDSNLVEWKSKITFNLVVGGNYFWWRGGGGILKVIVVGGEKWESTGKLNTIKTDM